jgi:hypothetical protein
MAPKCIRLTELADLLGVSRSSLAHAARDAGLPVIQVRRVILEQPGNHGGPLYLPVESAIQVASLVLGKKCDRLLAMALKRRAAKQDEAFGGARVEVGLA